MFKHIDMSAAMQRLAERKIEQAIDEGKFANLEGAGRPIDLEPMPADENARMLWWAIRILRKNDFVPDEIRYRKTIDQLRRQLNAARDEAQLRSIINEHNFWVTKLNTMGTNVIESGVALLDADTEAARWRQQRRGTA